MAVQYQGQICHTEDSIHALFRTRYSTYHMRRLVLTAVIGVLLIAAGLFAPLPLWGQGLLLLAGCLLFAFRDLPATLQAEDTLAARKSGLPTAECTFYTGHMELREAGLQKKLRYEKLDRLVSDRNYLYFFFGPDSVVMVDKATITPGSAGDLMELAGSRSGKHWEAPVSLLTLNLRDLLRMWDERRARRQKRS